MAVCRGFGPTRIGVLKRVHAEVNSETAAYGERRAAPVRTAGHRGVASNFGAELPPHRKCYILRVIFSDDPSSPTPVIIKELSRPVSTSKAQRPR